MERLPEARGEQGSAACAPAGTASRDPGGQQQQDEAEHQGEQALMTNGFGGWCARLDKPTFAAAMPKGGV